MDDAYNIFDYLPIIFPNKEEKNYIDSLFKAFQMSYENNFYQFAYLQFHMLFMICIYFLFLKIEKIHTKEFDKAIYYLCKDRKKQFYSDKNTKEAFVFNREGKLENKKILYFGSFAFLNETDALRILKIIDIDSTLMGKLKKLVKERNTYAHANGNVDIKSQDTIDKRIYQYLEKIEEVYKLSEAMIIKNYEKNMNDKMFYHIDYRIETDDFEQIKQELIKEYFLSKMDLSFCSNFNINEFENNEDYVFIEDLHKSLCNIYNDMQ